MFKYANFQAFTLKTGHTNFNGVHMRVTNNLRLAFRQLRKNRLTTLMNFTGLSIGLAFCFLTCIWHRFEHSFDNHLPHADRLYRMDYEANFEGSTFVIARTPAPFAALMLDYFPEIEAVTRIFHRSLSLRTPSNDRELEIKDALFADSTTMQVMGFQTLYGDPDRALRTPFSLVLTDQTARRLFGKTNVLGEQVLLANQGPFTVGAIIKAQPENSNLSFELIAPFRNIPDVEPASARAEILDVLENNKMASYTFTYVLLRAGADPEKVNLRFKDFIQLHGMEQLKGKQNFRLIAARDIHLKSTADEQVPAANASLLWIFILIGALILAIACVNFINLSTAGQLLRAKEVGVRKALGSSKWQIIGQHLAETLLIGFPAFVVALLLVKLFSPLMSAFLGRSPDFQFSQNWGMVAVFLGISVLACLLAGLYPAVFAARFRAVDIFRGTVVGGVGRSGNLLPKTLIVLQFTVTVALLAGTGIILGQLDYLQNRPLGFDREWVLDVPLFSPDMNSHFMPGDPLLRSRTNAFEEKLLQDPRVLAVTMADNLPGVGNVRHPVATEKIRIEDGMVLPAVSVDYDYIKTFGMKIIAGRDFDKSYGVDHIESFIINEQTVKALGWVSADEAIGQNIQRGGKKGRVVGVVNDFHTQSLHTGIEPLLLEVSPGTFTRFGIKIAGTDAQSTLSFIEKTWRQHFPEKVFERQFLTKTLAEAYEAESQFSKMIALFAGVAIFLSCFGLFGMIAFAVRRRVKEIGIRKVLGASVAGITGLLAKDFLKLVLIATFIASPVAYYFMQKWLTDFAFRIEIQWWMFAGAGAMAVLIAFLTVGAQSVKAALANPVKSLRNE
jgi:putative ABC transport system permease protein